MDSLYQLFRSSMRWNTAGALVYQLLLVAHQAALFKVMAPADYGVMSIVLSMIYLGALIADGGFDAALSSFFVSMSTSKESFTRLAVPHWLAEGITAALVSGFLVYVAGLSSMTQALSPLVLWSAALMLMAESFRRSLRMTLQLAFKAQIVSLVDVGMLVVYLTFIWGSYIWGAALSLELLIFSLALLSAASAVALAVMVVRWVATLPAEHSTPTQPTVTHRQLTWHRLINSGNLISHQIFSGNILVPLVAMSSGLNNAGIVKLASYLAHGLVTITRKIFGFSGTALLSALKKKSHEEKQNAFWRLSRALYATLIFSVIALASMSLHLFAHESATSHYALSLCLLIGLIISEGLYLVYEAVYIIEEKSLYLVLLNGAAALIAGLLLSFPATWLSTLSLLVIIVLIRLALFVFMALGAYKLFNLYPPRPILNPDLFAKATVLVAIAYACGTPLALLLAR